MEEKKGISAVLLVIIFILIIIISSTITIIVYRNILKSDGENHLVDTMNEDLNNIKDSEKNDLNNADTLSDNASLKLPINMNGKNVNVDIETSFVNWEREEEGLFNQKTVLKINNKVFDELETTRMTISGTLNYEIPEINLIADSSIEKEYILLTMHENTPSSSSTILKIYDDEGNVISEFDNLGKTQVVVKENNYAIPVYEIYSDRIVICEALSEGGARLHEYTIDNGELKDEVVREYSEDEVEQAGATA